MGILTTANQLTLLRMLLIPLFVILLVYDEAGWALAVFITAGITDGLDGLIARLSNQRTSLGAWLDPMADKLLLVTSFVVLSIPGIGLVNRIPVWLTVLVLTRDVGIVVTVTVVNLAVGPRTFRPSAYGKAATATYILTVVSVLFFNYLGYHSLVVDVAVWCSLGLTLVSGLHYVAHARRIINEPQTSGASPSATGNSSTSGTAISLSTDAAVVAREAALISSDAAVVSGQNATLSSDAATLSSDATMLSTDWAVMSGQAATLSTDAAMLSSDATMLSTDGAVVSGQAATLSSDAAMLSTDAAVGGREAALISSDAAVVSGAAATLSSDAALLSGETMSLPNDPVSPASAPPVSV